jgi:hypothetical protein
MLDKTLSSRTPSEFHPRAAAGGFEASPMIASCAINGLPGKGYIAVGMNRAFDSEIGLPKRSTRAWEMLGFRTPPDVRRYFMAQRSWQESSAQPTITHRRIAM